MSFDIKHLTAFISVARGGSLGRAAHALNITQPALSRTIRRLEDQVGAPLFERYTTGMVLTPAGQALLPHAESLQHEAELAIETINELRGLTRGTIRVGAVASVISQLLPMAIARVLERWPRLQIEMAEGVGDILSGALLRHEIDLVISTELPPHPDIQRFSELFWHDTNTIVAASNHSLRQQPRLHMADIAQEKWVIPPRGTAPYQELHALFTQYQLSAPDIVVETRSITACKALVAHAGFLSWMPIPMYSPEQQAGLVAPLEVEGSRQHRQLFVFHRKQGILPPPALKLLEALRSFPAEVPT
ncbi:MAG: LysR family transcriptional regulator [Pigmentiphaga sp.]